MQKKPLVIDTVEYLTALCSIIEKDKGAATIVKGSSMAPFLISNKSWVYLQKPSEKLKKGDIALYVRDNKAFVLHRVYRVDADELYFIGDAQSVVEGPVSLSCVKAVVTKYKRKNKWHNCTTLVWKFYSTVWIKIIPMRSFFMKIYFRLAKFFRKVKRKLSK